MPLPNWQLNYKGLSKLRFFEDFLKNFSIKHGYKSTLTINEFSTDYQYEEQSGRPIAVNEQTNNFYSRYKIPSVIINESFSPLLGIKMETQNDISVSVDFKKSRDLALELDHYKLDENRSTEYTIGVGYIIKNFELPGQQRKKKRKKRRTQESTLGSLLGSADSPEGRDLELSFDFSLRDHIKQAHSLDENVNPDAYSGSKTITISPAASYKWSNNLTFRLFFDYIQTNPYTSRQYKRTTMEGGLTVQFTLN